MVVTPGREGAGSYDPPRAVYSYPRVKGCPKNTRWKVLVDEVTRPLACISSASFWWLHSLFQVTSSWCFQQMDLKIHPVLPYTNLPENSTSPAMSETAVRAPSPCWSRETPSVSTSTISKTSALDAMEKNALIAMDRPSMGRRFVPRHDMSRLNRFSWHFGSHARLDHRTVFGLGECFFPTIDLSDLPRRPSDLGVYYRETSQFGAPEEGNLTNRID